ncbi:MAG: T9SS type A sorting domain-containing protein [Ignavibacteria bacterium]|nr:T9SS type A sorting domain-containing protein [Ignavibacteria bacterium]
MNRVASISILIVAILALTVPGATAQIRSDTLTIRQIQEVPLDSLNAGKQNSPALGDTVTVTGTVIAAPRVSPGGPMLFALSNAATLYIVDEAGGIWSGLNVRATDTVASSSTLITAVDTGFVVRFTGVVTQYFTTTQFEVGKIASWNADKQVEILDTKLRRPQPNTITLADLVKGDPKTGIPLAQQWEGGYVVINNLTVGTVTKNTSTGRYTWTVADANGNSIGVYDQSKYFRGGTDAIDPAWTPPSPGTAIQAIRGIITSSGQGIVIAPIYPGDILVGSFPPTISKVGRTLGIPKSSESVSVSATIETGRPGGTISEAKLVYGIGAATSGTLDMAYDSASKIGTAVIPPLPDGAVVWYYITARDNSNENAQFPADISKARPFYIVRDGNARIRDIQYTPYSDGVPGSLGFTATTRGTVTAAADSTSLGLVFIQDDTQPWSGMMVRGDANVRGLKLGDDVTVIGKVAEGYSSSSNGNTLLLDAAIVQKNGSAAVPAPIALTTGGFKTESVTDGTPSAEQWEGMLVTFSTLNVTKSNADEATGGRFGEFLVNDGSGDMRVDDFGSWKTVYTTDSLKTSLLYLKKGTTISSLTGIMYFNFGNYKLQPRNAGDFGSVTDVATTPGTPTGFALRSVYPNPATLVGGAAIVFDVPELSQVRVDVVDALGRLIATPATGSFAPGSHTARFAAPGRASGVYFVRLHAGNVTLTQKLIIH